MLSAHDIVAQKKFDPVLPPLPEDLDDDFEEESVKIVRLVKNKEPLVSFCKNLKSCSEQRKPELQFSKQQKSICGFTYLEKMFY